MEPTQPDGEVIFRSVAAASRAERLAAWRELLRTYRELIEVGATPDEAANILAGLLRGAGRREGLD